MTYDRPLKEADIWHKSDEASEGRVSWRLNCIGEKTFSDNNEAGGCRSRHLAAGHARYANIKSNYHPGGEGTLPRPKCVYRSLSVTTVAWGDY